MILNSYVPDELYLLNHPFYQAWQNGNLSMETLRHYASQYYFHVEAFPQYLRNLIQLAPNDQSIHILKDNLSEEDGSKFGTPHPQLWLQFANGLGLSNKEVFSEKPSLGISEVIKTFSDFSTSSYAEGLGSIYAYESQVPEVAETKIEGLRKYFNLQNEESLSFFELHRIADIEHRDSIRMLIDDLKPNEKLKAKAAAHQCCQMLWNFLTEMNENEKMNVHYA